MDHEHDLNNSIIQELVLLEHGCMIIMCYCG